MHSFSFGEIALIFGIVIILFGGSRLASIGKSLGEGIANFKKGLNGNEDTAKNSTQQESNQSSFSQKNSVAYTPPQVVAHHDAQKNTSHAAHVIDVEQKELRQ